MFQEVGDWKQPASWCMRLRRSLQQIQTCDNVVWHISISLFRLLRYIADSSSLVHPVSGQWSSFQMAGKWDGCWHISGLKVIIKHGPWTIHREFRGPVPLLLSWGTWGRMSSAPFPSARHVRSGFSKRASINSELVQKTVSSVIPTKAMLPT